MTGQLRHVVQRTPQERRVILSGEITEEADFAPLLTELQPLGKELVVDLGAVARINSSGLREWLDFTRTCNTQGAKLVLERCSPIVVTQLNMILNFGGKDGKVRSVYAPYYCSKCDNEHLELIELKSGATPEVQDTLPCPKCGGELDFDDVSEVYLQFHSAQF